MLGGVSYMSVSQDIIFLSRYTKQPMHSTIFQKILNYIEKKMDEGTTKVYTEKIWTVLMAIVTELHSSPHKCYIYIAPPKNQFMKWNYVLYISKISHATTNYKFNLKKHIHI